MTERYTNEMLDAALEARIEALERSERRERADGWEPRRALEVGAAVGGRPRGTVREVWLRR